MHRARSTGLIQQAGLPLTDLVACLMPQVRFTTFGGKQRLILGSQQFQVCAQEQDTTAALQESAEPIAWFCSESSFMTLSGHHRWGEPMIFYDL
jgi:hypothetical protein